MSGPDELSCDPRNWCWLKLRLELKNGMPAVVTEFNRRMTPIGNTSPKFRGGR